MTAPVTYIVPSESTSPKWGAAFAQGCGGTIERTNLLRPGPVALFGSPERWHLLQQAWAQGRPWYYGDKAYFGRGQFFRVTLNAMQHTGEGVSDGRRFDRFAIPVRPWRKTGRHIVLCPQSQGFFHKFGGSVDAWLTEVQAFLRHHTDRPFVIRWKTDTRPLVVDLRDAWALVTFMSNAAVEAALAGVPCFTTGPCAARTLGTGNLAHIESPALPDVEQRRRVACVLADNQWTLEEIARGDAWRHLQREAREAA